MPIISHTFNRRGDMVEIVFPGMEAFMADAETLKVVIETIQENRADFKTEAKYQEALNLYKSALHFLQGDGEQ